MYMLNFYGYLKLINVFVISYYSIILLFLIYCGQECSIEFVTIDKCVTNINKYHETVQH